MRYIYFLLILIGLNSCIGEPVPQIEYKQVNFDYSDCKDWFCFNSSKHDFLDYCKNLSLGFGSINDSVYRTYFSIGETTVQPFVKLILKESNFKTEIRLLEIDTISYLGDSRQDKGCLNKLNKLDCYNHFKTDFIKKLLISIGNCVRLDSFYLKGTENYNLNKFDLAYYYFDSVTQIKIREDGMFKFPQYSAYNRMGYIRIKQNKFNEAVNLFDMAFTIEPYWLNEDNRTKFRTEGKLPYWVKDYYVDELKSEYKYNSVRTYQLLIHANKSYALFRLGKMKQARKMLNSADKFYSKEPSTQIILGIDYFENRDYLKSAEIFDKLEKIEIDNLEFTYYQKDIKKKNK